MASRAVRFAIRMDRSSMNRILEPDDSRDADQVAWIQTRHAALVGRLTSDFAHDTLQPLAAMVNYLAAWRLTIQHDRERPIDPETQTVWLMELQEAADRAVRLVRRFRDFATLGYWTADEPWNLDQLVRESFQLLGMTQRAQRLEVSFEGSSLNREPHSTALSWPRVLVPVIEHLMRAEFESGRARKLTVHCEVNSDQARVRLQLRREGELSRGISDSTDWTLECQQLVRYADCFRFRLEWAVHETTVEAKIEAPPDRDDPATRVTHHHP